jgi:hypothetical protein
MDMRWPPGVVVIAPRVLARTDRHEAVAPFGIGQHAACTGEIRVERRVMLVDAVVVAPGGICLPDFDQDAGERL